MGHVNVNLAEPTFYSTALRHGEILGVMIESEVYCTSLHYNNVSLKHE